MNWKTKFPMFKNNPDMVYLDNSALTFKPYEVIKAGNDFYSKYSVSTRTSDTILGIRNIQEIEKVREVCGELLHASKDEILFTSGTTESLNLIINMISKLPLNKGEILISYYNHNSNIIPFIEAFKDKEFKIVYSDDEEDLISKINEKTRIISISQLNNNFILHHDLKSLYKKAKEVGAILINDAAQAIAHEEVNLKYWDAIAFSANKIYGPTGVGVLAIKKELMQKLSPAKFGGGQVNEINGCEWLSKDSIARFEPGTLNFAGIFQLKAAIEFWQNVGLDYIQKKEKELSIYLHDELSKLKNITIDSKRGDTIVLFNVNNVFSQDVVSYLGHKNIYVRSGVFCAHMFTKVKGRKPSYIRATVSFYNSKSDIDKLVDAIKKGGDFLDFLL
ncbi:cysteine desulfurase/selenocysteine lyase [Metamycoplasma subdolum]|uniref:Cysteine desulfurase/selenocysteine lyase n=1 Tax=Metamycoplasma subdolum TaxID=92407 RepID=A0A3M0A1J3_9BACT|nr:aminotransferase class V-fold PLP-dependent enzyme [Metamycoplasma subdolum]RMA78496.1 cysteine desulfurase/selenocysteine lyase [Metamycoplasma subdolum]WPB50428.1 aminotransferase class V-fold PLP-dependent enzyme [Metamycoplasma subdolum]